MSLPVSRLLETLHSIIWLKKDIFKKKVKKKPYTSGEFFLHEIPHFLVLASQFFHLSALLHLKHSSHLRDIPFTPVHECTPSRADPLSGSTAHPEVKLLVLLSATFLVSPLESYHLVTTCQELSHRP